MWFRLVSTYRIENNIYITYTCQNTNRNKPNLSIQIYRQNEGIKYR